MHVIATAGHVDHGKSTLVRALTGMEPDRWAEERRRGMTIDLGFAWTDLPSGNRIAFVDVPGHERFVANMLAGVGPVPAVMLVIAADEGWRAQTAEHVAALDALGVAHGLLVVSRCDLAEPRAALDEARKRLAGTSLAAIDAVTVSGRTGDGLKAVRTALDVLVSQLPATDLHAPVRLWVDRAFTIRGAGTVVTGTLGEGRLAVGDVVQLASTGERLHVRALQSCKKSMNAVEPVARVGVNVRNIAVDQIHRGDALVIPDTWHAATDVDVRLTTPVPAGRSVLHVGSAAVEVRVRPLGASDGVHARVTLSSTLPLRIGDRCLLRDPGRPALLAGARVLDIDPPSLRRRGDATRRAAALASADDVPTIDDIVRWRETLRLSTARAMGLNTDAAACIAVGEWLIDPRRWAVWEDALRTELGAASDPLSRGRTRGSLVRSLDLPHEILLDALLVEAGVDPGRAWIRAPSDGRPWDDAAEAALSDVETQLRTQPYAPPDAADLAARGLDRRILGAAVDANRLVRIARDVYLLPGSAEGAVDRLAQLPQPFTVSDASRELASTRRVVVPLLEHLDAAGWTRRVDAVHRIVLRRASAGR